MIGFVGLSHLGLVSSLAAAEKGFDILAYDDNTPLCDNLNRQQLPFFEPGLAELLSANAKRIAFTPDAERLSDCKVIYFSLDTATDENGTGDLSPLRQLIARVVRLVSAGTTLVILSQVPPGFTRRCALEFESELRGRDVQLFYQVETLIFGRAVERAIKPERIIVGCSDPAQSLPAAYAELLESFSCPIFPMRYESAELTKIAINMYLVSSISVTNTLAELCEKIGADWSEMMAPIKLDKRIGQHAYLTPGLGLAGGNLERDLATVIRIANELGADDGIVDAWVSNSRYRRDWVLNLLHERVISCAKDPIIAIWGLAYKQDTTSTKNSPALSLIDALKGFSMRVYDPQVVIDNNRRSNVVQTASALEACKDADALAVMTPWQEFSSISITQVKELMKGSVIIDPFGVLKGEKVAGCEASYFRLGSSSF